MPVVFTILAPQVFFFALRQLGKHGPSTDWQKVKADWDPRIRQIMPGDEYDDEACQVAHGLLDAIACAANHATDIEALAKLVEAKDYDAARVYLVGLIKSKVPLPHALWEVLASI